MSGNMKKIGTLLVGLALFASMLIVSTPVGADSRVIDMYINEVLVGAATPTIGDNITLTANIQAVDENGTSVTVTFEAVNGTDIINLGVFAAVDNVTKDAPTNIVAWWDSTTHVPDADLVYDIVATVSNGTADANTTNDTKTLADAVDWMAPEMGVEAMAGAGSGLIGDDYTVTVTVKNFGDAAFGDVVDVDVMDGATIAGTALYNATTTALAADTTDTIDVVIDTTGFSAGEVNFTADINGHNAFHLATFAAKEANVYVDDIAFGPAGVKHTAVVTITATLKNNGTADANITVTFKNGATVLGEVLEVEVPMDDSAVEVEYLWTTPASMATVQYLIWVSPEDGTEANGTVSVLPQPHTIFGVSGIAFNPTTLVAQEDVGDTQLVTATVTVTNTGDLDAVDATVTLLANGVEVDNALATIAAGGQEDVVFNYTATTKEDDAIVNVSASLLLGSDLASTWKNLSIPGDIDKAEFEITAIAVNPSTQQRGLSTTITIAVKNVGDLLADEITVKLMAGTSTIGTVTLVNISAGGGENTTEAIVWDIPMAFALGATELNATIEGIDDLFLVENFTVIEYKKPVLKVDFEMKNEKVKKYESEAAEGEKKTVKVKITLDNTDGTADAKNVDVVIKDAKGKELGNVTGLTVPAGGTLEQEIPIKFKAGTSAKLTATATYDGVNEESYPAVTTPEPMKVNIVKTPGFEAVIMVAAVAIALVLIGRRRK